MKPSHENVERRENMAKKKEEGKKESKTKKNQSIYVVSTDEKGNITKIVPKKK